jgi:hypothetical protein
MPELPIADAVQKWERKPWRWVSVNSQQNTLSRPSVTTASPWHEFSTKAHRNFAFLSIKLQRKLAMPSSIIQSESPTWNYTCIVHHKTRLYRFNNKTAQPVILKRGSNNIIIIIIIIIIIAVT